MEISLFHGAMLSLWSLRWGGLFQGAASSVPELVMDSCIPGSPRAMQGGMQSSSVGCKSTLFALGLRGLGVAAGLGAAMEAAHPPPEPGCCVVG